MDLKTLRMDNSKYVQIKTIFELKLKNCTVPNRKP